MSLSILKEKLIGTLPKPFTISNILQLNSKSKEIVELYDTNPNLVTLLNSDDGKIMLKRFGWRSKLHFYISPFMNSRAQMSWDIASILNEKKLTPKPIFVYTQRKWKFVFNNFYITQAIEPHKTFRKFIKEETDNDKIISVIKNLAISIAKMHELGIYHRDLTTGNFLVDDNLDIFIVDLNRAQNVRKLINKQRLKDLSKIHFKNTEFLSQQDSIKHFFQHYSKVSGININWEEEYLKYRVKMVKRRKNIKNFKNYFRLNRN